MANKIGNNDILPSEVQAASPAVCSEGSISAEHEQCHASPRNESPVASFEEFQVRLGV